MKRKMLSLILVLLMAMCLMPTAVFAEGEQEIDVKGTNLIKITTATDFAAGETTGIVQSGVGNGALPSGRRTQKTICVLRPLFSCFKPEKHRNIYIFDNTKCTR